MGVYSIVYSAFFLTSRKYNASCAHWNYELERTWFLGTVPFVMCLRACRVDIDVYLVYEWSASRGLENWPDIRGQPELLVVTFNSSRRRHNQVQPENLKLVAVVWTVCIASRLKIRFHCIALLCFLSENFQSDYRAGQNPVTLNQCLPTCLPRCG